MELLALPLACLLLRIANKYLIYYRYSTYFTAHHRASPIAVPLALLLACLLLRLALPRTLTLPQVSLHAWAGLFLRIRRTLYMRLASLPLAPPASLRLYKLTA